jgi:uncharacterized RDD family membrane protein YckC
MDIWIIRDGEKTGPFHDFEIRRKIEAGELSATTSAWHEGLTAWKPLVEIDLFTREFQLEKSAAEKAEEISSSLPESPPLPLEAKPKTYYMRRFWARWLDLALFSSLWWLGMWAAHQDIGSILVSPLHGFTQFIPWFIFEALLLHRFGTTPGKWLLGLRVVNAGDGSLLSLPAAARRCTLVLVVGIGFAWGPLSAICMIMSLITARRMGGAFGISPVATTSPPNGSARSAFSASSSFTMPRSRSRSPSSPPTSPCSSAIASLR